MSNQLYKLALYEHAKHFLGGDLYDKEPGEIFIDGFIAGRTSVNQNDVSVAVFEIIQELMPVSQVMADKASVLIAQRVAALLEGTYDDE